MTFCNISFPFFNKNYLDKDLFLPKLSTTRLVDSFTYLDNTFKSNNKPGKAKEVARRIQSGTRFNTDLDTY